MQFAQFSAPFGHTTARRHIPLVGCILSIIAFAQPPQFYLSRKAAQWLLIQILDYGWIPRLIIPPKIPCILPAIRKWPLNMLESLLDSQNFSSSTVWSWDWNISSEWLYSSLQPGGCNHATGETFSAQCNPNGGGLTLLLRQSVLCLATCMTVFMTVMRHSVWYKDSITLWLPLHAYRDMSRYRPTCNTSFGQYLQHKHTNTRSCLVAEGPLQGFYGRAGRSWTGPWPSIAWLAQDAS